ncbi:MAG: hypothetical protein N3A59_06875 [Thermodesulfovibrionales bacterium]|nr:hypothetical protein [Thermodesulfovibrionales bacterium]
MRFFTRFFISLTIIFFIISCSTKGVKQEQLETQPPIKPALEEHTRSSALQQVQQPTPPDKAQETQKSPLKPARESRAGGGSVSFFFDDADIFEVAQTVFGDILRVNYIIDPKVKGRVNFRTVTPIPREEVLPIMEIILRLNGIGYVFEKGLYRIVPLADVAKELVYAQIGKEPSDVAIEMFTFKNLNLKESMPDIENAIGLHLTGGTVRVMPIYRLNSLLVIAGSKEHLSYIRNWVETFDQIFAHARPKIFVYNLQNSKASHIASLLQSIFTGAPAAPTPTPTTTTTTGRTTTTTTTPTTPTPTPTPTPTTPRTGISTTATGTGFLVSADTRVFADEVTNSLIIVATPGDYAFIEETIKKLDVVPRQVMIEALIAEVELRDDLTFGIAWSLKTDINITNIKPFERDVNLSGVMGQRPSSIPEDISKGFIGSGFTFLATDPKGVVRAKLEALASQAKLKVIASPHILVSDNREARIQIGDQVPIATSETNVTGTTQIQRTIQYKDTGVILKVKPQVNDGGLVSLELTQEVSNFSIQRIFDSDQVVIKKREASTNLVVQDGNTIVIGGLIREDIQFSREGLPILSKIPLLGYLFGSTTDKNTRTELIMLLTPHVIKNQAEATELTHDHIERLQGVKKEMEEMIIIKGKKNNLEKTEILNNDKKIYEKTIP